jgi:hypothetical protein
MCGPIPSNISNRALEEWATVGHDLSSHGAAGQAFRRSLKSQPLAMQKMYTCLVADEKLKFRKAWSLDKSFQYVHKSRNHSLKHSSGTGDNGIYLPEAMIQQRLGGNTLEAERMMKNYVNQCRRMGGKFVKWNNWCEADFFLYIERLTTSWDEETFVEESKVSTEENLWDVKAKEGKALRNFAIAHNLSVDRVSISDVETSTEGVEGWAAAVCCVPARLAITGGAPPAATPAPKAKPKAKPKAAATAGADKKSTAYAEKKMKGLIATENTVAREIQKFQKLVAGDHFIAVVAEASCPTRPQDPKNWAPRSSYIFH